MHPSALNYHKNDKLEVQYELHLRHTQQTLKQMSFHAPLASVTPLGLCTDVKIRHKVRNVPTCSLLVQARSRPHTLMASLVLTEDRSAWQT